MGDEAYKVRRIEEKVLRLVNTIGYNILCFLHQGIHYKVVYFKERTFARGERKDGMKCTRRLDAVDSICQRGIQIDIV